MHSNRTGYIQDLNSENRIKCETVEDHLFKQSWAKYTEYSNDMMQHYLYSVLNILFYILEAGLVTTDHNYICTTLYICLFIILSSTMQSQE